MRESAYFTGLQNTRRKYDKCRGEGHESRKSIRVVMATIALVIVMATGCGQIETVSEITADAFELGVIKKADSGGKMKETVEEFDVLFDKYGEDQSYLACMEIFKSVANNLYKILET